MSASVVPDSLSAENAPLSPKPHLTEAKPVRRRYSREEKLRILRLVDTCAERGQVAAILRREGLYYSTLNDFRKQQQQGRLETKTERIKPHHHDNENELARLRRENARLQHQLEKAELIIDVQKKVSQLLGLTLATQRDAPEP
jgi:transposase